MAALCSYLLFRQSSEGGGPLPPDPDCACEDSKTCSGVPEGEVPVFCPAGHTNSQRQSGHSRGKQGSAGVQVSGEHVNPTAKELHSQERFTYTLKENRY